MTILGELVAKDHTKSLWLIKFAIKFQLVLSVLVSLQPLIAGDTLSFFTFSGMVGCSPRVANRPLSVLRFA